MIELVRHLLPAEGEACGFITRDWKVIRIRNIAGSHGEFRMQPDEQLAALDRFSEIEGIWHSHPSGELTPSQSDIVHAPRGIWKMRYWIVTPQGGWAEWEFENGEATCIYLAHPVPDGPAAA